MRKRLLLYILPWILAGNISAQVLSDSARSYLITCSPGQEAWARYGHTALAVIDPSQSIEAVFNYGIFDFNTENFYYRFAIGDTWYQLGIEPLHPFLTSYAAEGRKVYIQQLNLTTAQQQALLDALMVNYQPENRFYHYNFVFNNCATQPYLLLKRVLGDTILSTYPGYSGTPFREAISHYTGKGGWLDYAINMVFGSAADRPMTNEERLFLPEELMFYISHAQLHDGTPLVRHEHIAPFQVAPVPWWKTCYAGMALFVVLMILLTLFDRRRHRLSWGVDVLLGVVWLCVIGISIFLTFFSCHPLVGFNARLLLFPLLHVCTRIVYWFR